MAKKKVILNQREKWLKSAEGLIKKQPREFMIGFVTLIILLLLSVYLTLYFAWQNIQANTKIIMQEKQIQQNKSAAKYYQMQQGESLWDVAQKEYGDPYLYPTLVELNNLETPDAVEPGMKIRVR